MSEALMALATKEGIFAALFVFAFIFIIKESKSRETHQRNLFLKLSDSLEKTKDSIAMIENEMARVDNNSSEILKELNEAKITISLMLDMIVNSKKIK